MVTDWVVGVARGPRDSERREPFLLGTVTYKGVNVMYGGDKGLTQERAGTGVHMHIL